MCINAVLKLDQKYYFKEFSDLTYLYMSAHTKKRTNSQNNNEKYVILKFSVIIHGLTGGALGGSGVVRRGVRGSLSVVLQCWRQP